LEFDKGGISIKQIIALILVVSCVLALFGCSNADKEKEVSTTNNNENVTTNTNSTEHPVGYPLPDKRVWDWRHPDDSEKNPYFSISIDSLGGALIERSEDDSKIFVDGEYLLGGPGVYCTSIYLADITGDGKYELCFGMDTGSGIVDCNIVVFDYETKECIFSLSDRMYHDYFLFVRNGVLCVMETEYMQREPVRTGVLINDGTEISVAWDSELNASYDRDS